MFAARVRQARHGLVIVAAVVAAALVGCQTPTGPSAPVTRTLDSGVTQITVTIPVTNDRYVRAQMYAPPGSTTKPVPGVIVFPTYYGMMFGESEQFDGDYAMALTKLGYATLVPVMNQHGMRAYHPVHAADLVAVARWFRDRPEVSDDRLGAVGFSAGAYHAAVLGSNDPATRAIVGYYGPYDAARFAPRAEDKATAVINYPEKMHAAVLLLSGTQDDETLHAQHTEAYSRGLKGAGKTVDMVAYPGAYHRFDRGPALIARGNERATGHTHRLDPAARDDAWRRTVAWLQKYLGD